jgi:hypothetical protein
MAEQPRLDVGPFKRPLEQGIVEQINLANGEVVGSAPLRVHQLELCRRQRLRGGLGPIFPRHSAAPLQNIAASMGGPGGSLP